MIARQRPGTAKGFLFLSLEDETGVANAIVTPDLFQKNRLLLTSAQFLIVEGILQNLDHVISVKADACCRYGLPRRRRVRTISTEPARFAGSSFFWRMESKSSTRKFLNGSCPLFGFILHEPAKIFSAKPGHIHSHFGLL